MFAVFSGHRYEDRHSIEENWRFVRKIGVRWAVSPEAAEISDFGVAAFAPSTDYNIRSLS